MMNTWSMLIDAQGLQELTDQRRERLAAQWGHRWRITGRRNDRAERERSSGVAVQPNRPGGHDLAA
jgi:hypothetical protein